MDLRRRCPRPGSPRATVRRGGFASQDDAEQVLHRFLEGEAGGFDADPNQTVADYLNSRLSAKDLVLKPTTMARYRDYVRNDPIPGFGTLRLEQLGHRHIAAFATNQLTAGRGKVTLSSPHNPASPPVLRRPPSPVRRIWTSEQAARFLAYCHEADPYMADLFEVLIGTGMRRGEALDLHWDDVHLSECVLYVRSTLSAIDNNRLVLTTPKTRSSRSWVANSPHVATALHHRAPTAPYARSDPADPFAGLVFCQADGRPLRPHLVLDRLHRLSDEVGVPRVTVHDLRHLAATITAGVPLTVVSKTLRHSTLSTTANLYSHLTQQAAREAVDTIDRTLTQATTTGLPADRPTGLRPPRDHIRSLREAFRRLRNPAPPAVSTAVNQPRPRRATRPPHPQNTRKAALSITRERPPTCDNTLRDDRI
ncbi:tyrosine-type recombinase/integrase [Streptomyces sp. NPDC057889]|uniref:tyrosine-type recombinase/integrase n=1 Tax=unclassified Streptomyces TaxID=2593676 RepID=UPI00369B70F7